MTSPSHALIQSWKSARWTPSPAHLAQLTSRPLPILHDYPTRIPSRLLDATLSEFLPIPPTPSAPSIWESRKYIPPGHHLIYFPPANRLSALLADGTDPDQSPGAPFLRRLWAGGSIDFRPSTDARGIAMDGRHAVCLERIVDVEMKGSPEHGKVFVRMERRMGHSDPNDGPTTTDGSIRRFLLDDQNCAIIEGRNLVFLRDQEQEGEAARQNIRKIVKPTMKPTFSYYLTPTAAMLFRFSALSFNAHRIHLDKQYCQETERYRNLLVHGPLSVVLMLEMLRHHLASHSGARTETEISNIDYRNLAPLYAEEELTVCGRFTKENKWDVWITGRDEGYAVKGVVTTRSEED